MRFVISCVKRRFLFSIGTCSIRILLIVNSFLEVHSVKRDTNNVCSILERISGSFWISQFRGGIWIIDLHNDTEIAKCWSITCIKSLFTKKWYNSHQVISCDSTLNDSQLYLIGVYYEGTTDLSFEELSKIFDKTLEYLFHGETTLRFLPKD